MKYSVNTMSVNIHFVFAASVFLYVGHIVFGGLNFSPFFGGGG